MINDTPARKSGWIDGTAWGVALLAMVPMLIAYALHYLCAPSGFSATGFLQTDLPSYMAEARSFFSGGFWPFYGLPFSPDDATPRIYFQPLMFGMGVAQKLTALDPGTIFVITGIVAGILMFRLAIAMEAAFYGRPRTASEWLAVIALLWGGGIVVFYSLGLLVVAKLEHQPVWLLQALFASDAGDGSWFPYLGRNVYFANEAFYHVVWFLAIVLLVQRRYAATLVVLAFMAASHPITGIELLLIVGAFAALEFLVNRATAPPLWFTAGVGVIVALHLFYYIVALSLLSEEHRQVQSQFDVARVLTVENIVSAYLPVFVLAVIALLRRQRWRMVLANSHLRLLLVWATVAFVLANHELFMTPRQPVHFTRGYIWIPLALLALPMIEAAFRTVLDLRGRRRIVALSLLLGLILMDDVVWFGRQYYLTLSHGDHIQQYISRDMKAVIARLGAPDMRGRLLLSSNQRLSYLTVVYVPMRSWMSHGDLSPHVDERAKDLERFFATGQEVDSWRTRPLVAVADISGDAALTERLKAAGFTPVGSFGSFEVLTRPAEPRT